MRAVAGGGRYDSLISLISDGSADLPAAGFGMGDVVITDLIAECETAAAQLSAAVASSSAMDAYVVIADENHRAQAIGIVQKLREAGLRTEYPLSPVKVGKQFQAAGQTGCRAAVVVGQEFPSVNVKNLATREEVEVDATEATAALTNILNADS